MSSSTVAHSSETPTVRDLFELFKELVLQSPRWVRVVVVLMASLLIALYVLNLIGVYPPRQGVSLQYPTTNGKQVPGEGDPQMAQVTAQLLADDAHSRWHDEHPEDNPPLKKVFQIADDNYLGYRFFDKSDHCVFVIRKESGKTSSHWLRDPQLQASIASEDKHPQTAPPHSTDPSIVARLLDALVPSAEAATLGDPGLSPEAMARTAQNACVSGTHPGEFTWWWGTPEDQCWAPMYRQWKDGCKHYQRFNKCANAWDDAIHWVSCSAGTHS